MAAVTTTYLEMVSRTQLIAKKSDDARFRVVAAPRQWQFNRSLYVLVGEAWAWHDKLSWSDDRWKSYVQADTLRTFVAYYDEATAGYFELLSKDDEIEIAYFGLAPEFIGRGLGGPLLTQAIEAAWDLNPKRVWVHTCTLDHPAALQNYRARGMRVYKTETKEPNQAPEN